MSETGRAAPWSKFKKPRLPPSPGSGSLLATLGSERTSRVGKQGPRGEGHGLGGQEGDRDSVRDRVGVGREDGQGSVIEGHLSIPPPLNFYFPGKRPRP